MRFFVPALLLSLASASCAPLAAQNSLSERLGTAACEGNLDRVRSLISLGASVNAHLERCDCPGRLGEPLGDTPLMLAAEQGHNDAVKLLLKAGAQINATDDVHWTPLIMAARSPFPLAGSKSPGGYVDTVRLLLANGANINAQDGRGRTALVWALVDAHNDTARVLLGAGADPNLHADLPAVAAAAQGGAGIDLVRLLIAHGARLAAAPREESPLNAAAATGNTELLDLLLQSGAPLNGRGDVGRTALEVASPRAMRLLLARGADPELPSRLGETALIATIASSTQGNMEDLRLLLQHGVNLEARLYIGATALWLAANNRNPGQLRALLDAGASIDAKANNGFTPLIAAVCSDSQSENGSDDEIAVVRALVERGAEIDTQASDGKAAASCPERILAPNLLTALESARRLHAQILALQGQPAPARFAALRALFAANPDDLYLRSLVAAAATQLPQRPEVPAAAHALISQATQQIRQAASPTALDAPIASLRQAIELAPWYGPAYYDLALALELQSKYEAAISNLNLYLALQSPNAAQARRLLAKIDAEEAAAEQH